MVDLKYNYISKIDLQFIYLGINFLMDVKDKGK